MRPHYTNRPAGRSTAVEPQARGSKTSYVTLLALFGFAFGIVGGYHFLGSPHKSLGVVRRTTIEDVHTFHGGDASIHSARAGKGDVVRRSPVARRAGTPDVIVIASPPHVLVGDNDERHPKNKAAILAGQSSHDEHKSDTLAAMQQQHSDVSEAAAKKTAAVSGSSSGSSDAKEKGGTKEGGKQEDGSTRKKDAKTAVADILAATGHDQLPAVDGSSNNATAGGAAGTNTSSTATTAAAAATTASTAADAADAAVKGPNASGNQPHAPSLLTGAKPSTKPEDAAASKGSSSSSTGEKSTPDDTKASNILTTEQLHDGKVLPDDHAAAVHMTGDKSSAKTTTTLASPPPPVPAEKVTTATAASAAGGTSAGRPKGDTVHTLFTSNGSPYQNFQGRIMVGTYNIVRKQPGGEHMVAITRILHRTKLDGFEVEMPTFRADPLQPKCDQWCEFPVSDRANAVKQWIAAADKDPSLVKGAWLLLLECDYVWIKPIPVPGDAWDPKVPGRSFAFNYIRADHHIVAEILKERCPDCDPKTVPNSGPAPVMLRFEDLKKATPVWEELTTWIETHEHAKKQLGWVREMYAWDIAVAMFKINLLNQGPRETCLISQPPQDHSSYNTSMYHYTWGSIWSQQGKEIWKWDKRFYTDMKDSLKVPLLALPPVVNDTTVRQHDGVVIDKALRDTLADMITRMNAAIVTLPDLTNTITPNR